MQHLLKDARSRYTDLYDAVPIVFFTLDDQGIILEINQTSATLLGNECVHMLGQPFTLWLADDKRLLFLSNCNVHSALASGSTLN